MPCCKKPCCERPCCSKPCCPKPCCPKPCCPCCKLPKININIFHCCGKSAKPVVKAIAFIDLLFAIGAALTALLIVVYYPDAVMAQKEPKVKELHNTPTIVLIILIIAFFLVEACLFPVIQSALRDRDAGQCDNWFKLRLVLICIFIFGIVYFLTTAVTINQVYIAGAACIFISLYRVYSLFIVKSFYLEILSSKQVELGHVLSIL